MNKNDPMKYNFEKLKERVLDTLRFSNVSKQLQKIKGPTICVGSGGSKVVADFAALVLNTKNNCSVKVSDPRDVLYENLAPYKNLFVCSYSGNNHGVNILSSLKIKKHLLTYKEGKKENYNTLSCISTLDKEMSFISLAATLMPMSILLSYYLNKDISDLIEEMFNRVQNQKFVIKNTLLPFEVMSGNDTSSPQVYLDSTFVESGLNTITTHSKYDFCHGRSTLAYTKESNLIYLISNKKELDDLLLTNLENRYSSIITLQSDYEDPIIANFHLTLQVMYLTEYLATKQNIDLSIVNYDKELCKKLYKYTGEM